MAFEIISSCVICVKNVSLALFVKYWGNC